ncbi:MAG: hypothetical protein N2544_15515, partial [Burkholderiales bacterium]|nr:hypothetical protein [Burkholderiales bacterium]
MSLLLDALKKAEQAKQASAEGATPAEAAPAEAPAAEPLMTRDRLPDISGLELAPDDLSPPPRQSAAAESRMPEPPSSLSLAEPEGTAAAAPDRRPRPRTTDDNAAARDAARQVFEAKQMDYNPRRPFFITLGALAAVAVGAGVYFWWQLQPKSNFAVAKAPPPPAAAHPAAVQP